MKQYVLAILLGVCWYQPFQCASENLQEIPLSNIKTLSLQEKLVNKIAIAWESESDEVRLSIWDNTTKTISKEFTTTDGGELPGLADVGLITWSSNNQLAIEWENASNEKKLSIWDDTTDMIIRNFDATDFPDVTSFQWSTWSSNNQLAIEWIYSDGTNSGKNLSIWDGNTQNITHFDTTTSGSELFELDTIAAVVWSPNNKLAISWINKNSDKKLSIWNSTTDTMQTFDIDFAVDDFGEVLMSNVFVWLSESELALIWSDASGNRKLSIIESSDGSIIQTFDNPQLPELRDVIFFVWSLDNHLAIMWGNESDERKLSIWDKTDNTIIKTFDATDFVNLQYVLGFISLTWSPDNHLAIAWVNEGDEVKLSIWDNTRKTISKEFTTTDGGELPGLANVGQSVWLSDTHFPIAWVNENNEEKLSIWDGSNNSLNSVFDLIDYNGYNRHDKLKRFAALNAAQALHNFKYHIGYDVIEEELQTQLPASPQKQIIIQTYMNILLQAVIDYHNTYQNENLLTNLRNLNVPPHDHTDLTALTLSSQETAVLQNIVNNVSDFLQNMHDYFNQ